MNCKIFVNALVKEIHMYMYLKSGFNIQQKYATFFSIIGKTHELLFKVIDGDKEPSRFQDMLMNSTKQCFE